MARTAAEAAQAKAAADLAAAEKAWADWSSTRPTPLHAGAAQAAFARTVDLGHDAGGGPGRRCSRQALAEEAKKQAEAAGEMTPEARAGSFEARTLEQLVDAKLPGNIKQFVGSVRPAAGSGAEVSGHGAPGIVSGERRDCSPVG